MTADGRSGRWSKRSSCRGRYCLFFALLISAGLSIPVTLYRQLSGGGFELRASSLLKPGSNDTRRLGANSSTASRSDHVTIVTAFFNIGTFAKGDPNNVRGPKTYMQWITVYASIGNAVVAYFDDASMAQHFTKLRAGKPTKVVMVDRKNTWAFSLEGRIRKVFDQPGYPQNHPKSTNAAYACAMHAKYELTAQTVEDDPFGTVYFAWLDVGLFRDLSSGDSWGRRLGVSAGVSDAPFVITAPACHRSDAIAVSKVREISDRSVEEIMRDGPIWMSGACLLATADSMLDFCRDYVRRVEDLLVSGLANDDQTVILSMYAPSSSWIAAVPLQGFEEFGEDSKDFNEWFYIAYLQRQEWLERDSVWPVARRKRRARGCSYTLYK